MISLVSVTRQMDGRPSTNSKTTTQTAHASHSGEIVQIVACLAEGGHGAMSHSTTCFSWEFPIPFGPVHHPSATAHAHHPSDTHTAHRVHLRNVRPSIVHVSASMRNECLTVCSMPFTHCARSLTRIPSSFISHATRNTHTHTHTHTHTYTICISTNTYSPQQ